MSKYNREKRTSVRGNTAKYTPEKPLFGKFVGSVYRSEHERGISEQTATIETIQPQDDDLASKMFFYNGYDNEIICPYCGDNYVHFTQARQIPGKDSYKASDVYDIGVRGDVIVIPFWCESGGHEWVLVLGEHKGNISYKTVLLDKEQAREEKNSMTTKHLEERPKNKTITSENRGGPVILELWPNEAKLLMKAIDTHLIQIVEHLGTDIGLTENYVELQSLISNVRGQLKMLDLVNKQIGG